MLVTLFGRSGAAGISRGRLALGGAAGAFLFLLQGGARNAEEADRSESQGKKTCHSECVGWKPSTYERGLESPFALLA